MPDIMAELEQIQKDILSHLHSVPNEHMNYVHEELNVLKDSEGFDEKNNLETFYEIWQEHKEEKGDLNTINSWVAFYLGMTSKKPDGDFLTERKAFARAGMPDIDTDFDDLHRQEIFDYIIEKYGRGNVGNIGTYGALVTKSCLIRLIKALDIADAFKKGKAECTTENMEMVNKVLESFPKDFIAGKLQVKGDDDEFHPINSVKDAYQLLPNFKYYMDKYPEVMKHAEHIEGLVSTISSHASGIVISDIPLSRIAPLRVTKKTPATQFVHEDLESIGLIKFDVLALSTLTILRKTVDLVKDNYGIELDLENLPLDDKPTLELFRSGNLAGVFQCGSYPMQKVMREIGVDRFEDVCAAIALFRPGPMRNIPEYCARKHGEKSVDYFHPVIEPFIKPYLEDTYGIGVYQEQIMQICNSLAGFNIVDGYVMIKGIGKKKKDIIDRFRVQFVAGCVQNKVPESVAEQYWDKFIVPFSSYGFNRAHSAAYGLLAWACSYLKANYPEEFACSFLNTEVMRAKYEKIEMMEKDIQKTMGIKILPCAINECDVEYIIVKKKDVSAGIHKSEIRPSMVCKGVGEAAARNIVDNRPYKDISQLAKKTKTIVSTETLGALIDNGFFKGKRGIDKKDQMIEEFKKERLAAKSASAKGLPRIDLFEDE